MWCSDCRTVPAMQGAERCEGCEGERLGGRQAGARPVTGAPPPGNVYAPPPAYAQDPPSPAYAQGPLPPYAPAPAPDAYLSSPRGLALATVVLLAVCAVVDLVSLYAGFTMLGVLNQALGDGVEDVAVSDLDRADALQAGVALAQLAVNLAAAVLFVLWFRRVRVNAEVFAPDGHRMSRGWSIGGWFVPVVNLWFPKKIANDIWNASLPYGPDGAPRAVSRAGMNVWWALWLVTTVIGWVGGRLYDVAQKFETLRIATGVLIVGDVVDIAAAVFAVIFVLQLTAFQGEKAAQGPVPPTAMAV